jgi:preprotein translocase subunit SecE
MDTSKRLVNIFFVGSLFLAWGIFAKTIELVYGWFSVRDYHLLGKSFTETTLLGAGLALALIFWCRKNARVSTTINEVVDELIKVTWPGWEETRNNSRMTVIVTVIIAAILWTFDQVFGHLTSILLGSGS